METIKITIDNKQVEVEKGTTILDAARKMGIGWSCGLGTQNGDISRWVVIAA